MPVMYRCQLKWNKEKDRIIEGFEGIKFLEWQTKGRSESCYNNLDSLTLANYESLSVILCFLWSFDQTTQASWFKDSGIDFIRISKNIYH